MKTHVGFCSAADNLMKAAEIMRRRECGAVPIVDERNRVVGMLTDRDVCLAVAARNRKASDVKCSELINGCKTVVFCAAEDKLEDALRKMRKHQIDRLAAIGAGGELVGILSIGDVLPAARRDKKLKKKIYATLEKISKPRPIVLREKESEEAKR